MSAQQLDVRALVQELCVQAKEAARRLAQASAEDKNQMLLTLAGLLKEEKSFLQQSNQKDLEAGRAAQLTSAMLDRLTLSDRVINEMAAGLTEVAALPDPVGEITGMAQRPNGLLVGRQRIPLGVIGFIYESRPNVTVDAAGLCLKSGNAVVLKGGKEALNSNLALMELIREALLSQGLPPAAAALIPTTEREATLALLQQEDLVDVIIPRGGESLIRFVAQNSRVPVLKHYKGVCHIYVDQGADLQMAREIIVNAKCQRPGVCNALETLLVHKDEAQEFLPLLAQDMADNKVELRGCQQTCSVLPQAGLAQDEDWAEEYLDLILAVKIVENLKQACDHIARYGSRHTEAIITRDYQRGMEFLKNVDSSVVLLNASTRFNDGGQLGLGAEIGISTSKLHAFGPMGLAELTSLKFIVLGQGQVRL